MEDFDFPVVMDIEDTIQMEDQPEMRLVSQQCWSKITYIFGLIGPEIAFFCKQD